MNTFPRSAAFGAAKVLVAGGLVFATVASWSAPRATSQLGVSVTIIDQCAVGNPAGAQTSWVCTNGTTATLAFGLGNNANGAYRRLVPTSATASTEPASGGPADAVRLTIMFAP